MLVTPFLFSLLLKGRPSFLAVELKQGRSRSQNHWDGVRGFEQNETGSWVPFLCHLPLPARFSDRWQCWPSLGTTTVLVLPPEKESVRAPGLAHP